MNKQFELDIIDYELSAVKKTKIMLQKLLSKKGRQNEHSKILSESLNQSREREQELLNERAQIQKTIGSGGDIGLAGVTENNEEKV